MAQKVAVITECDYPHDGEAPEVSGKRRFTWEGEEYEIDVCGEHAGVFDEQWKEIAAEAEELVAHSRRITAARSRAKTKPAPGGQGRTAARREKSGQIRAWAKANGIVISDRGRIPVTIEEQYDQEHGL